MIYPIFQYAYFVNDMKRHRTNGIGYMVPDLSYLSLTTRQTSSSIAARIRKQMFLTASAISVTTRFNSSSSTMKPRRFIATCTRLAKKAFITSAAW